MAKKRGRSRQQQARARTARTASGSGAVATSGSTPGQTATTGGGQTTKKPSAGPSDRQRTSSAPANRKRAVAAAPPSRGASVRSGLGRPITIGVIALVLVGGFYGFQWWQSRKPPAPLAFVPVSTDVAQDPDLAGLQTGPAPWDAALGTLRARLEQIGLPALSQEVVDLHFHVHLDVFVDGKAVEVPEDVGRNAGAGLITVIHTHDGSGVIHIESPKGKQYTLGQVFDVWGVRFTRTCLGADCNQGDRQMRVYADGQQLRVDPRRLILGSHQEIVVTFGTLDQVPSPIPSKYGFPLGA